MCLCAPLLACRYVAPEDVALFKAAGADEVLPKPLTKARIDQLPAKNKGE